MEQIRYWRIEILDVVYNDWVEHMLREDENFRFEIF